MNVKILKIENITPLHVGGITPDPVVDNTIQRNSITKEPTIFSSSLKGAIKSHFYRYFKEKFIENLEKEIIEKQVSKNLNISNNLLSLFLFGKGGGEGNDTNSGQIAYLGLTDGLFLCFNNNYTQNSKKKFIELAKAFKVENIDEIEKQINQRSINDEGIKTEIRTHNAIDYDTGQAKDGHLWTEEYVNPNTVFCSFMILNDYIPYSNNENEMNIESDKYKEFREILIKHFMLFLDKYLIQIGAGESLGQGYSKIEELTDESI